MIKMLKENINVRQRENEGYRRWFTNSFFDLIVWYDKKGGRITGIQICYSKNKWEKAFTWTEEYQSSHIVSDSFVERGFSNMSTGILKDDGGIIPGEIIERFNMEAENLEPEIKNLVLEKITEYNQKRSK